MQPITARSQKMRESSLPQDVLGCALGAAIGINAVFTYSFATAWRRRGAPFVPSARNKVNAIFHSEHGLLRSVGSRRSAMHLVDLGSGSGSIVRAAVREGGFGRATGIELNPALVAYSRLLSLGQGEHERFELKNMWLADLADADVVFVYGVPSIMPELSKKLREELRVGTLVVSNGFEVAGLGPAEEAVWVDAGLKRGSLDDSSRVYLYRIQIQGGSLGKS